LGDEVRIDAYCLLNAGKGYIELGSKVHLASHVRLIGGGGIFFGLGSGASSGVCVYSQSDDFTDGFLAHPTVPIKLRRITSARVEVGPLAIIGPNSVLLPGVIMGTGAVLGAMSLLKSSIPRLEIFGGTPANKIGVRAEQEFNRNAFELGVE
jgi:galactoside O-acetyltransferase